MKHFRQVLRRTLDPVWKERFEIRVYSDSSSILEISVYDYEEFGFSDNFIGRFVPRFVLSELSEVLFSTFVCIPNFVSQSLCPKVVSQSLYPKVCIPNYCRIQ